MANDATTGDFEFYLTSETATQEAIAKARTIPAGTSSSNAPHNRSMSMTREEMEAHLKAQAADTRAAMAEQNRAIDARLADFGSRVDRAIEQLKDDRVAMREDSRSTRNTVVGSALAILLALFGSVYAIGSMNSGIVGNVISAFEAGRTAAAPAPQQPASAPK